MKNRTQNRLIALSIVFILLMAIYLTKANFSTWYQPKPSTLLSSIKPADINEIVLVNNSEKITLFRKNNQWFSKNKDGEFRADSARISELMAAVSSLSKTEVVSSNKSKREIFGLDDQKIVFKTPSSSHTLYIGKSIGSKNYVSADKDTAIFTAEGFVTTYSPFDYRDLTVPLVQNESAVSSLKLLYEGQDWTLIKKDNNWLIDGKKAKKDQVDFYINNLKTLKANNITKQDISQLFSIMTLTIQENEAEKVIQFYQKSEDEYLANISGLPDIFSFPHSSVLSLQVNSEEFMQ